MLGDYVARCVTGVAYRVPELHHRPARALEQVGSACGDVAAADLTLVGSSLGGFYATVMAERLGCRAALLNPAVHPHRHFARYLGAQTNLYTGESFILTPDHVDELRAADPPAITRPERYWLFVETGDEVLDYREAVARYEGALHEVVRGGDHTLVSFPELIPDIVDWAAS
ncbi:MAG: esterase [Pseudomonadota bacterium]|nr:esterase [Pseudomonadota bacterium]